MYCRKPIYLSTTTYIDFAQPQSETHTLPARTDRSKWIISGFIFFLIDGGSMLDCSLEKATLYSPTTSMISKVVLMSRLEG